MKTLLISLLLVSSAHAAPSLEQFAKESIRKHQKVADTGMALMVFDHGELVLKKGFGFADREAKTPVTENTLFAIGSTTKAFTSLAMLMAEEQGLLDMSRPVRDYLPDYSLNRADVLEQINTYDLLSHRSGLPRHDLLFYMTDFSRPELFYRMRYLEFNAKPELGFRKGFQYNNLMYMTAGVLLERVTGLKWERYVEQKILQRLGMHGTRTEMRDAVRSGLTAAPYSADVRIPPKEILGIAPAGSIYSSVNELEHWVRLLLANGKLPDGSRFVSEAQWAKLFSNQTRIDDPNRDMYYGLGWLIMNTPEMQVVFHNGNIDGYSAMIFLVPKSGIAVVALENQNGSSVGTKVSNDIAKFLLAKPEADRASSVLDALQKASLRLESVPSKGLKRFSYVENAGGKDVAPIDVAKLAGIWRNPGYGDLIIHYENGSWNARYYLFGGPLRTAEENVLVFPIQVQGTDYEFPVIVEESGGKTTLQMILESEVAPIRFERVQ